MRRGDRLALGSYQSLAHGVQKRRITVVSPATRESGSPVVEGRGWIGRMGGESGPVRAVGGGVADGSIADRSAADQGGDRSVRPINGAQTRG
jgi:hypothetical protein